jgi:hypothetical protein
LDHLSFFRPARGKTLFAQALAMVGAIEEKLGSTIHAKVIDMKTSPGIGRRKCASAARARRARSTLAIQSFCRIMLRRIG